MSREIRLDWERKLRTGLSEAVMCRNKSLRQLQMILDEVEEAGATMLFTRLKQKLAGRLQTRRGQFDYDPVSRTGIYSINPLELKDISAEMAIVSGGSADLPVAREALRTINAGGCRPEEIYDVGVAGLWRIQEHLDSLSRKKIIICVAGMDAALPTVLGGLVPGLIIAVPTSVGYGAAKGGKTALNALLCSCAQGLVVVNIDNGFGAACAAMRALSR